MKGNNGKRFFTFLYGWMAAATGTALFIAVLIAHEWRVAFDIFAALLLASPIYAYLKNKANNISSQIGNNQ